MRTFPGYIFLIIATLLFSGGKYQSKHQIEKDAHIIGVLYWSNNIQGQVVMRQGLEDEVDRINRLAGGTQKPAIILKTAVAGDGEAGIRNQIRQMEEMLVSGVDLIIVQPTDNAALTPQLKKANDLGIPVIAYDQYIMGGELLSYLTSDNFQAGYLNGEYVAANFDDQKSVRIVLVDYPQVSSTIERVEGFIKALQDANQPFTVLATYEAVEPVSGEIAGQQILIDFPEKGSIDVVFTVNDGGGLSVVDQLASAGRNEIFIATVDGDPASVKNIENGRLTRIDSAQFCGQLGAEAVRTAYRYLNGETVPKHQKLPAFPITVETVHHFYGWGGDYAKNFVKPWASLNPEWTNKISLFSSIF